MSAFTRSRLAPVLLTALIATSLAAFQAPPAAQPELPPNVYRVGSG